jgi:protease-4
MVKYLLGVLSGFVLAILLALAVLVAAVMIQSADPAIPSDAVLEIRLSGPVPEHMATDFSLEFLESGMPPTLLQIRNAFKKAAKDDRIRAIVLRCGGLSVGWGKAQEIRWAIEEFKESGKPVVAFLQVGSSLDYLIASAADQVFLTPEGFLDVKGLRAEVSFYKNTLQKLGVTAELFQSGKYKAGVEPWMRTSMSDEFREVLNSVLDEVYGQFLESIGSSRGKSIEELRGILDSGPFSPPQALEAGLVDGLHYEDEFFDALKERLGLEDLNRLRLRQYRSVSLASLGLSGEHRIALVYAVGSILRGKDETESFFGADILGSDSFSQTLREVKDNDDIEAVVVRIDSPGGDAFASDQIWREMNRLSEEKPLVISFSDAAASGGYYIAMANAPIVAYPGTMTGSIGAYYGKLNLRGLYDKIGISKEIITRGRFAAIDSDYRGFAPEERDKLRQELEVLYRNFVQKVADARKREWDDIHQIAQGRVWMGSQAVANGLVDEIGGLDRAIEMAKEAAGLEPTDKVTLVTYPTPKKFIDVLLDPDRFATRSPAVDRLRAYFAGIDSWPALLQGGFLRIAPYSITIQ